jgi:flagellar hook-length control protein FliK
MSNVNALAQVTASTPTTKTGAQICENCEGDNPSFASLLATAEDNTVQMTEQQNQLTGELATPVPVAGSLLASVLSALATNESLSPEQQMAAETTTADNDNKPLPSSEADIDPTLLTELIGIQPAEAETKAETKTETDTLAPDTEAAVLLNIGDEAPTDELQKSPAVQPIVAPVEIVAQKNKTVQPANLLMGDNPEIIKTPGLQGAETPVPVEGSKTPTNIAAAPASGKNEFAPLMAAAPAETAPAKNSAADPTVQQAVATPEGSKVSLDTPTLKADQTIEGNLAPKADLTPKGDMAIKTDMAPTKADQNDLKPTQSAELSSTSKPVEASGSQTNSTGDKASSQQGQQSNQENPSSLAQKLKPLQQAASLFQAQDNSAQTSVKTPDLVVPSLTISPTGEMARPTGIEGLTSTTNNPSTPQVPLNNVAVHIAAQAKAGNHKFNIRLDPPELGRIDIRLEINRDGQTLTHLAVEKPETLDMLRQDSRALERALNNAGLDSRSGNLSFSLREDNSNRQQAGKSDQDDSQWSGQNTNEENEVSEPVVERTLNVSSGIDISI